MEPTSGGSGGDSGGGMMGGIFGAIFGTIDKSKEGMQAQQAAETAKWFQAGKYTPEQTKDLIFLIAMIVLLVVVLFFFRRK